MSHSHLILLLLNYFRYRYYHVFQKGELEHCFQQIATFHNKFSIQKCDYEYGNWYILLDGIGQ